MTSTDGATAPRRRKSANLAGPDIFISYARDDAPVARRFADAFGTEGLDVWWDDALRAGDVFDETIESALRAAKCVVVLWSPRSVSSRWVRAEATLADRNKTLVPATIQACDRPIIFELTHTADLGHWAGDPQDSVWRTFLASVCGTVERGRAAEAPPPVTPPAPVPIDPGEPSLAIMPFSNRSGAPSDDVFAFGMVEDLISALSTGDIQIISSSATRSYRDQAYDIRKVGEELGARYLLEGNVRRMGADLRVTVQLADTVNGSILWTQKFDRPLADIAALQEDLVVELAAQLGMQVVRIEIERALRKPGNLTAWELALRASTTTLRQTRDGMSEGIALARQAVALAPDFVEAHIQLAMSASIAFWQVSGSRDEALSKEARNAIKSALRLAPDSPKVLGAAAQTLCTLGMWREGLSYAERAHEIAPDREYSRAAMIMACIYFKRTEEALQHIDAHDRLAPRGPQAHIRMVQRAGCYFMLGDHEAALRTAERTVMLMPDFNVAHWNIAINLEKLGRRAEAIEAMREIREISPHLTLDLVEKIHRGSLLAPDVAMDMYETFATVWRALEASGAPD
jgi:TolB-like protein